MNSGKESRLGRALRGRCDVVAGRWYKAVARTSSIPLGAAKARRRLVELTEQIVTIMLAEPFDHDSAQAIGASLAEIYRQPEALDQTQRVLARELVEGLTTDQIVALQPQIAAMLGGLAVGFLRQTRERILAEQEQIRSALTVELRQRGQALRESHDELERRVGERTAELAAANAQLVQEITERVQAEDLIRVQHNLALALNAGPGFDEGLRLCIKAALHVSGMDCGGVYLADESSGALDLIFHTGLPSDFVRSASHYDADSANARLVRAGKPVYTEYLVHHPD